MSHLAVVHIADWLSDADGAYSIDTLLETVPRYGSDALPETPTVYNEYEHDWVSVGLPDTADELATVPITFPLVAVKFAGLDMTRSPHAQNSTGLVTDELLRITVDIAVRSTSPAANARDLSYYARAVENSLFALGFAADASRTITGAGIILWRVQNKSRAPLVGTKGDLFTGLTISASYALTETTPLTA